MAVAAYSVIDAQAVRHTSPAGYLGVVLALEGVLLTVCLRPDRQFLRQAFGPGLLIAIGTVIAYPALASVWCYFPPQSTFR